jgi:hypothetical protein
MTLSRAVSTGCSCYAEVGRKTFTIRTDGWLNITQELPNGKTEIEWYTDYKNAIEDYPLDTYNWHILEN